MSFALFRRVTVLLLLAVGAALSARAQEADTTGQQLPEIAPREIEIRGELQVSFPTLERQPLDGFASPPSLPTVPAGHMPYMASYKQRLENLPESLPSPTTVTQTVDRPEPPQSGFMEFGGGRYASRFVAGHLTLPFSNRQTLFFDADYSGTEGFSPFPSSAPALDTPVDQVEAQLRFESRHDDLSVQATAAGIGSEYTLYGDPTLTGGSSSSVPERSALLGTGALELRTYGSVESRIGLHYESTSYATQITPTASTRATYQERRFGLDGSLSVPLGTTFLHLDVAADRASYGGALPGGSGYDVGGGLSAEVLSTDRLSARVGGHVLTFASPTDPRTPSTSSTTASFIVPEGRIEYRLRPGVSVYAANQPELTRKGLSSLYRRNPYAEHGGPVHPTLFTTNAKSGAVVSAGAVKVQARAGYRYAPSYQYFFTPSGGASLQPGSAIAVGYGSARILHAGGAIALQGVSGVEASLGVTARDGSLAGQNTDIPYFSRIVADALLSISFDDQRGYLEAVGTIESPRPVNRSTDTELGTYVHFDVEGSYGITSLLDLVVEVRNLGVGAPKRWAQYPHPPAVVMGGFRIHW